MVHQHFMLIPKFTVLENVILGGKLDREPLLDTRAARKRILDLSAKTGLKVDPDAHTPSIPRGPSSTRRSRPAPVSTPVTVSRRKITLKHTTKAQIFSIAWRDCLTDSVKAAVRCLA